MNDKRYKVVDTTDKTLSKKDRVVDQAKNRFRRVYNYESTNRSEGVDDLKMIAGFDHWPAKVVREREVDDRPCLTINKLPSFVDQVVNDSRLNTIAIKIKPAGSGTTKEMAETINGLIRNIEAESNADVAYQTALEGAVNNGFGYFRIVTSFIDETSFDQEIKFKRIRNPFTVYLDDAHTEHDGEDIQFAFVTEMVDRKEYKVRYPDIDIVPFDGNNGDDNATLWFEENKVRIAEYWVKEPDKKKLYLLSDGRTVDGDEWDKIADDLKAGEKMMHLAPNPQDPQGQPVPVEGPAPEGSEFPEEIINPTPTIERERVVNSHKVVQYLIDGSQIIEGPTEFPSKYIPIVPVWGKEIVIGEERFLRSLIRFAKDPQRMYNYFRTAATETVALAPKAPYIVEEEQVEDNLEDWSAVNRKNLPFLSYKHKNGVPPPMRQVVTQTAMGEITEANISDDEMKSTTSLHNASLGAQGNEVSGRAIFARQREGDVANFTFHDNLKRGIEYAGKILVDLIPRIYDTHRQVVIIRADEEEEIITINQPVLDAATNETVIINDLTAGRYKVVSSSGPSFTTQREEAAQSMMDFMRVAPDAAQFMIDLVAENMDWPGATKIANRFKKLLPPGIDDEGSLQKPQPTIDDIFKELKAKGTALGNEKKKLDIVKQRGEMTDEAQENAEAGARGVMGALMGGGE